MKVISLKDYAKQNNISYEAVRQQVVRYKDDLAEHIIRDGRQQFLDEEAVAFLDSKRQKNPVAIIQQDKDEQIESLQNENKLLLQQLAVVQDELIKAKDRVNNLELENTKIALLEADNEAQRVKIAEADKNAQKLSDELSEARKQFEDEMHLIQNELQAEKSRKLTWKERLLGKKD